MLAAAGDDGAVRRVVRVFGVAGAFRDWGVVILQALTTARSEEFDIVVVDVRSPVATDVANDTAIVMLDDVSQILAGFLAEGLEPMAAVRIVTERLSLLEPAINMPGALLVRRTEAFDVTAVLRMFAALLFGDNCHIRNDVMERLPPLPGWRPLVGGQALTLCRQILAPMAVLVAGNEAVVVLPLACFLSGNHTDELAAPLMELSGPRRPIYYGPYFHLPGGQWRAATQLLILEGLPKTELSVEFVSGDHVSKVRMEPSQAGLFEIWLSFRIEDPAVPFEFRIWVEHGAIEGIIGLRHITLHRLSEDPGRDLA